TAGAAEISAAGRDEPLRQRYRLPLAGDRVRLGHRLARAEPPDRRTDPVAFAPVAGHVSRRYDRAAPRHAHRHRHSHLGPRAHLARPACSAGDHLMDAITETVEGAPPIAAEPPI